MKGFKQSGVKKQTKHDQTLSLNLFFWASSTWCCRPKFFPMYISIKRHSWFFKSWWCLLYFGHVRTWTAGKSWPLLKPFCLKLSSNAQYECLILTYKYIQNPRYKLKARLLTAMFWGIAHWRYNHVQYEVTNQFYALLNHVLIHHVVLSITFALWATILLSHKIFSIGKCSSDFQGAHIHIVREPLHNV